MECHSRVLLNAVDFRVFWTKLLCIQELGVPWICREPEVKDLVVSFF